MPRAETKTKSRLLILSWIAGFSLALRGKNGTDWPALEGSAFRKVDVPTKGALVALFCAPIPNDWYLSWVVQVDEDSKRVLLESIETGRLAWWSNVWFHQYEGGEHSPSPQWRWTDRQHELNDRWMRVAAKSTDGYVNRAVPVAFGDGWSAEFGTRTTHGRDDIRPVRKVNDWRKLRVRDLAQLHAECSTEAQAERDRRRAQQG